MDSSNFVSSQEVDLSNCDREAIHIPGSIQPHGVLLVLQEPDLKILQASNNTEQFFGVAAELLIDQNISILFSQPQIQVIKNCILEETTDGLNPLTLSVKQQGKARFFDGIIHRNNGVLILELEPGLSTSKKYAQNFYNLVKASVTKIKKASNFKEATELIVKEVRRVTGYDRVMLYRFEPDDSGIVIAEDKKEGLETYLDLHYPASDIPKQARKLYYENWLRLIVDMNYQPVEILPPNNPLTGLPLDLSFSVLRSVSPLHREYCKNMGVTASICISLVNERKLWGLIVGHHYSPKFIDYRTRNYCEFLGQLISVYLVKKQEEELEAYRQNISSLNQEFKQILSGKSEVSSHILEPNSQSLLDLVRATGAVIHWDNQITLLGETPPKEEVQDLLSWLSKSCRQELFFTNSLAKHYPKAKEFQDNGSGLLAISIFVNQTSYRILWFRPELIQTVNWGRDPNKSAVNENNDTPRISPQKSFELWKETVREKCLPWQQIEIDAARELRNTLMVAVLELSQAALEEAARQAEIANRAKSQFLAKMSHELRTPLNAILGFTQLLMRENSLPSEQLKNLGIINRSGEHLLELINDVLEMSKIEAGRLILNEHSFDLHRVLNLIQEMLQLKASAKGLQLIFHQTPEVPQYVICDESKLRQVLLNLLENALKFTLQGSVTLRINAENVIEQKAENYLIKNPSATIKTVRLLFAVEDTGQGIAPEEIPSLFDPFVQTETGRKSMQGTGLGLPISQQFVGLMGGDIHVSSTLGKGSIFCFDILVRLAGKTDVQTASNFKKVISLKPNQAQNRILIAEDVKENRDLMIKLLKSVGFEVRSAVNGVEVVALWQEWKPDLILMDIQMPMMDGYEATQKIKATAKGQETVIIALTAHAFRDEQNNALSVGCDDFMSKPFREEVLFQKLTDHLGVQYIYEQENQSILPKLSEPPLQLTKDALSVMPQEWLQQLHRAAISIDEEGVLKLLAEIPQKEAKLATILADLVENFRLDIIADLT